MSDSQSPDRALQVQSYESKQLITRYWHDSLRPCAGLMTLAFAVMMIEGSTLGALSYLIEPLFDKVFTPKGQPALVWVGLGIFGLFVLRATCSIISKY